jgi:hypothetical protein
MIVCNKCWGTKKQNGINNISRECGDCQGKGYKIPLNNVITTVSDSNNDINQEVKETVVINQIKRGRPKVEKDNK